MLFKVNIRALFCLIVIVNITNVQSNSGLTKILEALNRVIDFSGGYGNDIDISFYFGLYLANVNLKLTLQEKNNVLPKKLFDYLKEMIRKIENVLDLFKYKINKMNDPSSIKYKPILSLFANASIWMNRLPKFHITRLNETTSYIGKVYTPWNLYKKNVDDRNAWLPNPLQSDLCLTSLASAEVIKFGTSSICRLLKSCYEMLENGTDFGYALAHRLLLLQQAKFARGCSVFSEQEDSKMRRRFCSAAYQEAEYIALHHFEIVDLLLEHVCLCALEGFAQFLKRSWLIKILSFQTLLGCFSPFSESVTNKVTDAVDNDMDGWMDGRCDRHTTAVAAGTLSLASRLLLQYLY